ncbi:hypothetical protein FRC07_004227 [Ceratobasidium sp. 392]|nr:hypothetical protein FRC07_004227 [Ceratobasidium sp. 392]
MPHLAAFSDFMIFAGSILPRTSEYSLVCYNALQILFLIVSAIFISIHGTAYVAWSRLNASAVRDVLMNDEPGNQSTQHGRGMGDRSSRAKAVGAE